MTHSFINSQCAKTIVTTAFQVIGKLNAAISKSSVLKAKADNMSKPQVYKV